MGLDVYDFINKNGSDFFELATECESEETVTLIANLVIPKTQLNQIFDHCEKAGITVEDWLQDLTGAWLNDG